MNEFMEGLFSNSTQIVLDFRNISKETPDELNIEKYFEQCTDNNINPRLPENRQAFNDLAIDSTRSRYLIGGYAENRVSMLGDTEIGRQGRTYHLGVDIFSKELELIYTPCDGVIVESGYEPGFGSYGNFIVFKPNNLTNTWLFFGHLSKDTPKNTSFQAKDPIARLGDYIDNENGGWSRHLHLQVLNEYVPGVTPIGYSTYENLLLNKNRFPNPLGLFPGWSIKTNPNIHVTS